MTLLLGKATDPPAGIFVLFCFVLDDLVLRPVAGDLLALNGEADIIRVRYLLLFSRFITESIHSSHRARPEQRLVRW